MTFADHLAKIGLEARSIQVQYADAVIKALREKGKISLLNADTGVGKSMGYAIPALERMEELRQQGKKLRIIVATHSHALMNQLVDKDFHEIHKLAEINGWVKPSVGRLIGRSNFVSQERLKRLKFYNPSMSQHDTNVLNKLAGWDRTIAEFIEEHGELPSTIDRQDICLTPECDQEDFSDRQMQAIRSDIVVTTHAMIALDMLLGHRLLKLGDINTVLIVDEADALIDTLLETQQQRLNLIQLRNKMEPYLTAKQLGELSKLIDEARDAAEGKKYTFTAESRAFVLACLKKIAAMTLNDEMNEIRREIGGMMSNFSTSLGLGVSDVRKEPAFVSLNPYFSRSFSGYIKKYYELSLLTSATLSITNDPRKGMAWARKDLGIEDEEVGQVGIFSPENYGKMNIELAGAGFPSIYIRDKESAPRLSGAWMTAVADVITKDNRPTVILTSSHKESGLLASIIRTKTSLPVYEHCSGEPLRLHIQAFIDKPGLLITAAGHVGMNIRDKAGKGVFHRLVITRISYAQPDEDAVMALADFFASRGQDRLAQLKQQAFVKCQNDAIRKMRQAMGRGIRSPNDEVDVVILDPRFPVEGDGSSKHAAFRNVIPMRFRTAYADALIHRPVMNVEPTEVIF